MNKSAFLPTEIEFLEQFVVLVTNAKKYSDEGKNPPETLCLSAAQLIININNCAHLNYLESVIKHYGTE